MFGRIAKLTQHVYQSILMIGWPYGKYALIFDTVIQYVPIHIEKSEA